MRAQRKGVAGAMVVACAALAMPAVALAVSPKVRGPQAARDAAKPYFDSREKQRAAGLVSTAERSARSALTRRLGDQADVSTDRVTGTVRTMQRLDGALTAPASGDRGTVAMSWVRANRTALGLSAADVDGLTES